MDNNGLPYWSLRKELGTFLLAILFVIGCVLIMLALSFFASTHLASSGSLSHLGNHTGAAYYQPIDRGDFNINF